MSKALHIKIVLTATVVFFAGMGNSNAQLLQLTHDPLFLDQSVPPLIIMTHDDSGSMERAWIAPSSGFSNTLRAFASPDSNKIYYNPNIEYTPPLRADGTQFPDSNPTSAIADGYYLYNDFSNNPRRVNLTNNYVPIYQFDYERDLDVRLRFARTSGVPGIARVRNDRNFYNNYPRDRDLSRDGFDNIGVPAFYFRWIGNANATLADQQATNSDANWQLVQVPNNQMQNFANWYTYYNSRNKLARSAISRAFSTFGPDFKIAWQELNDQTTFSTIDEFTGTHKNNFFNWLFTTPTQGGTPLRRAFNRAGQVAQNDNAYFSDNFGRILTCQQNFHIAVSDGQWNQSFSTTLTQDEGVGGNIPGDTENRYGAYNGSGESAIYPQADSGSSLADIAYHYWANDLRPNMTNNVRRFKGDFTDAAGNEITVAAGEDVWERPEFYWNPKNDPAYWQHLVTYNVGLGIDSSLVAACRANANCPPANAGTTDPREFVFRQLRLGNLDWGDPIPNGENNPRKFDDVWHSSINSRGDFFSAQDPQELADALTAVVNNIIERLSRGSASAVSSGVVTSNTIAYSPSFDSSTWSGFLTARRVNPDGNFGEVLWEAGCTLDGGTTNDQGICNDPDTSQSNFAARNLFAYDKAADSVVNFTGSLSGNVATEFAESSLELRNQTGATIPQLVDFIRGDRSEEILNGGTLRTREGVLADIVHSSAVVIRGPSEPYIDALWPQGSNEANAANTGNGYLDFKVNNLNRSNIALVGSNGGMLHAFKATAVDEGEELWGLIPSTVVKNLHRLADPSFEHWSYVDNTPTIRDVFINGNWTTTATTGLRYGGQGFIAMDVSNTTSTTPRVLWEFTDDDDSDMGFTYGRAEVVRLTSTGEWVALIPNGYNNSEPDNPDDLSDPDNVLGSGTAVMYVVRMRDGQLLAKIDTGVGSSATPNGLSTPLGVDSRFVTPPGESTARVDIGADIAYAGDLYGNLWRFDLTSSNPGDWESSFTRVVRANGVRAQPITSKPRVVAIPNSTSAANDVVVIFGTGKYIEIPDRSINLPATQYVVGVKDGISSPNSDLNINDAGFIEQTFSSAGDSRTLSENDVDLSNPSVYGWKIELPQRGERMVNPVSLIGNQVFLFFSIIPGGEDPCLAGGVTWLVAGNPLTGGVPDVGNIFSTDISTTDGNGNPITVVSSVSGLRIPVLIPGTPPILENQGGGVANIIIEGTGEGTDSTIVELKKFIWRRRNWTNLLTQ